MNFKAMHIILLTKLEESSMRSINRYIIKFDIIIVFICTFLFCYKYINNEKIQTGSATMEKKQVALTFDDGPHVKYTKQLLKGLKQRNVKATFFVVGENVKGCEDVISLMQQDGHLIGNHTFTHVQLNKLSVEKQLEEIIKTNETIYEITQNPVEYIRPPFGEWDKRTDKELEMFPVLWTIDTLDWTTSDVKSIVKRGTSDVKDGDIILMHDYYQSSVKAALEIVDLLQKEGFEFVTVDKLLIE